LLTAALLLRGVARASAVDPEMPVEHLLAISIDASRHGYEGEPLAALVREARRQIEALPSVRGTALVGPAPFSGARSATVVRRGDEPDSPGMSTFLADVSPEFLTVTDWRIVRGGWFTGSGPEEVVINEWLVRRLWPEGDPLGQRLTTGDFQGRSSHVVVGVVRDAPYAELRHQHEAFLLRPGRPGTILIRTAVPAASVVRVVTAAVKDIDASLTVTASRPDERIAQKREGNRRAIAAVAGIGGLALLIALGGVAAIASHSVVLRTREIGIRMALGARQSEAVALIVRFALTPVAIGALAGLGVAALGSRARQTALWREPAGSDVVHSHGGISRGVRDGCGLAACPTCRRR
jgi:hypothetical protein